MRLPPAERHIRLTVAAARAALGIAALALGLFVAFTAFAPSRTAAAIQTGDCTPGSWPANDASLASQVVSLINQHRASIGEGQLVTSPTLSASAVWKARHMAQFDYFDHDDPGPPTATTPARTFADRLQTCGYPYGAGENIAEGFPDAQSVVDAWLNSPGHKANIENASYVATGVGVAEGSNGEVYWVQDFGVVADNGSPPPPPPPPPPTTTSAPLPTTTAPPPPATTTTPGTSTGSSGGGGAGSTTTTPATTTSSGAGGSASPRTSATHLSLTEARVQVGSHRLLLATRVRSGSSAPSRATVKCTAQVGGRSLRVVINAYEGRLAHCAWRLPGALRRGAVVHGAVAVRSGGAHVRATFSLVVRPA